MGFSFRTLSFFLVYLFTFTFPTSRDGGDSLAVWKEWPAFQDQALAATPIGGRWRNLLHTSQPYRVLQLEEDVLSADAPAVAVGRASITQKTLDDYKAVHDAYARDMETRIETGQGLKIPSTSILRYIFKSDGTKSKYGFFGILARTEEFPELHHQLIVAQSEFLTRLRWAIARELNPEDPESADVREVQARYEAVIKELVPLEPEAFHLTIAGLQRGATFRPTSIRYWLLRQQVRKRSEELAKFRRAIGLEFNGQLSILTKGTPAIAAVLNPQTTKDLYRLLTLKTAYGTRLMSHDDKDDETAHISLFYLRGGDDWSISPDHLRWIVKASQSTERGLQGRAKDPLKWDVSRLEIRATDDPNSLGKREGPPIDLILPTRYEMAAIHGEQLLTEAWRTLTGRVNAILPLNALNATLGLFPQYHLRNRRSLQVAVHEGAMAPEEVVDLMANARKLGVQLMHFQEQEGRQPSNARFRLTSQDGQPGLLLTVSRLIDQYEGNVISLVLSKNVRMDDPIGTKTAIELEIQGLTREHVETLRKALSAIPDMHPRRTALGTAYFYWRRFTGAIGDQKTLHLHFTVDARSREPGQETRRSILLQALADLDPRSSVTSCVITRGAETVTIEITATVPASIAGLTQAKLQRALGASETVVKQTLPPEMPRDILLQRLGLQSVEDVITDSQFRSLIAIEIQDHKPTETEIDHLARLRSRNFGDWLSGSNAPIDPLTINRFMSYAWDRMHRTNRLDKSEELTFLKQAEDDLRARSAENVRLDAWPKNEPDETSLHHLEATIVPEQFAQPYTIHIMVIDSPDHSRSGGHYFLDYQPTLKYKQLFNVYLQARYFRAHRMHQLMDQLLLELAPQAAGFSREAGLAIYHGVPAESVKHIGSRRLLYPLVLLDREQVPLQSEALAAEDRRLRRAG